MKRFIIVFLFFSICPLRFSAQENEEKISFLTAYGFSSGIYDNTFIFVRRGNNFFLIRHQTKDYQRFQEKDIEYEANGYGYLKLFGKRYIVVPGPHDSIFVNTEGSEHSMVMKDVPVEATSKIEKISATSFLKEKLGNGQVVEYKPEKMLTVLYYRPLGDPTAFYHTGLPWAEGEAGPGIGTKITIEFKDWRPADHVLVLNGYVDFDKLNLYKANNRVKMFRVRSLDRGTAFNFTWNLEDKVKLQEIKFPRLTQKVELEILEVYRGEKWDDTCIRGFLLKDHDWSGEFKVDEGTQRWKDRANVYFEKYMSEYKEYVEP